MSRPATEARPRLLLMARGFPPELGGVETYSEEVALAYQRAGFDVTVVTAHPGPVGWDERAGVRVNNVGLGPQVRTAARMLRALSGLEPPDAIHATTWRVALPVLVRRLGRPLVTVHGREVRVVPRPLRPLMAWAFSRARAVIAVSPTARLALRTSLGTLPVPCGVAWNGTSLPALPGPRPPNAGGPVQVLSVSRLAERKNIVNAVEAVARLADEGHAIVYRIAGDGPEASAIDAAIRRRGAGAIIHRLGYVPGPELLRLYDEADIFLHPQVSSRDGADVEGFGIAIADAMARGCAVVVGADGGPADYVEDGRHGRVVAGDDVDAIATALRDLLLDPSGRAGLAEEGRRLAVRSFNWDAHVRTARATAGW